MLSMMSFSSILVSGGIKHQDKITLAFLTLYINTYKTPIKAKSTSSIFTSCQTISCRTGLYITRTIFFGRDTKTTISWFRNKVIVVCVVATTYSVCLYRFIAVNHLSLLVTICLLVNTFATTIRPECERLKPITGTRLACCSP